MKLVFSDIDNTLMFDLQVAPETLELIAQIRAQAPFALITARSYQSVSGIPPIPHDHLIVENGCVLYEGEAIDLVWDERLRPFLPLIAREQERLGLKTRPKTRMLSIGMTENQLTEADAERLERELPPELVLRRSSNERGRFLEIYPAIAGKASAVGYVAGKLGVAMPDTCCLGDDLVDLEMLGVCGFPVSYEGAREPVRALVRERGGCLAPGTGHAATWEMLRAVLRWVGG
jgi:hydroxymethylpyrimidine pyrophosphatase-like HAD family hydrolase